MILVSFDFSCEASTSMQYALTLRRRELLN